MVNAQDIFRILIKSDRTSQTKGTHCPRLAWQVFCLSLLGYRHPFMPLYSEMSLFSANLLEPLLVPQPSAQLRAVLSFLQDCHP